MSISRTVQICNRRGLHARASAKIVEASARFQSEIHVIKDGNEVHGRSIMGLMMLAASIGSEIEITAERGVPRRKPRVQPLGREPADVAPPRLHPMQERANRRI